MSTMKKVLSVALALVLCLAMCVPAFAADTKDPVDQIADAISGAGIDLGAITDMLSGLGDFDISSITGGDFDIGALTEMLGGLSDIDISSLKDTLLGALGGIGGGDFDIAGILNGLQDNELAQLIAKLYSIAPVEKETELPPSADRSSDRDRAGRNPRDGRFLRRHRGAWRYLCCGRCGVCLHPQEGSVSNPLF